MSTIRCTITYLAAQKISHHPSVSSTCTFFSKCLYLFIEKKTELGRDFVVVEENDHTTTIDEFKSLLAEQGIDPQRRSKLGLSHVVAEAEPKFLSELNISNKFTPASAGSGPGRRKNNNFSASGGRNVNVNININNNSRPNTMERRQRDADEVRRR